MKEDCEEFCYIPTIENTEGGMRCFVDYYNDGEYCWNGFKHFSEYNKCAFVNDKIIN
jgi:hypothetical protein